MNGHLAYRLKSEKENLGDWLALPIYDYMTSRYHLDKNKKVGKTKHLYTIGSLIMMGHQNATIWGSGILNSEQAVSIGQRTAYRVLDVRCVRGPETLQKLKENGIDVSKCKIGDPGVLMPLIYQPKEYEHKREYSVLIHKNLRKEKVENEIEILTDDWKKTIDEIYNHSTGRYNYPVCSTIEEALQIHIPEVPDLSQLQQNLIDSFPVDLWE